MTGVSKISSAFIPADMRRQEDGKVVEGFILQKTNFPDMDEFSLFHIKNLIELSQELFPREKPSRRSRV